MLSLFIFSTYSICLDNDKSPAIKSNNQSNSMDNYRAILDKFVQTAVSQSSLFNTTSDLQEKQTNAFIEIIETDDDEENDEQEQTKPKEEF
jgi:hypothetical protein